MMRMKLNLRPGVSAMAALLWLACCICQLSAATRPNIVFILADDMSWYGTGTEMEGGYKASAGKTRRTPNIDLLAKRGMTFSRAFAPAAMCAPSRCSFQTGMTAARTRFSGNGNFGTKSREVSYRGRRNKGQLMLEPEPLGSLDPDQDTIGEYLKSQGYATAHVGKWHIYGDGPGKNGYDVHDGETSNAEGNSKDPKDPKLMFSMTRKAMGFIENQTKAKKPFFVQVSHYAEHNAVQFLPETYEACMKDKEIRKIEPVALRKRVAERSAMVEDMDRAIGTLLKKLDDLGIRDNTYVVFMADNGHHRDTGEEKILRGNKWWLWECGIRVPMIVAGPGVAAGARSDANVAGYDLLPTFFELGGGAPAKLKDIDGVSLVSLFHDGADPKLANRALYFHYPHHRNTAMHSAVIQGDHKFFRFYERPGSRYLYHLDNDIGESTNVAERYPGIAARLGIEMDRYHASVEACLPKPNPKADPNYKPYDPDAHEEDAHGAGSKDGEKEKAKPKAKPDPKLSSEEKKAERREERKKGKSGAK